MTGEMRLVWMWWSMPLPTRRRRSWSTGRSQRRAFAQGNPSVAAGGYAVAVTSYRARFAPPLLVLATLVGLWVSHTLEIWQLTSSGVQLSGPVSLSPFGGVHNYMVAVGVFLLLLSAVGGGLLWRMWGRLSRRFETAKYRFRRLLRTGDASPASDHCDVVPSAQARLLSLWIPITTAQILLYVIQENIESAAVGRSLPWFGVLVGVHWAAPFIHAAVALALSSGIILATRPIASKVSEIAVVERAFSALASRLRRVAPKALVARAARQWLPLLAERLGADLWQRPPPVFA